MYALAKEIHSLKSHDVNLSRSKYSKVQTGLKKISTMLEYSQAPGSKL